MAARLNLFLIAAEWTNEPPKIEGDTPKSVIANIMLTPIGDPELMGEKRYVPFATDANGTAATKAAKWFCGQPVLMDSDHPLQSLHDYRIVGFEPYRIMHHLWLNSCRPDANGHYPNLMPFYSADPDKMICLPKVFGRGQESWVEFLQSRGFTQFPDKWTTIGTDLLFETACIFGMCLQMKLIQQEVKGGS